jgi:hypothetical protein
VAKLSESIRSRKIFAKLSRPRRCRYRSNQSPTSLRSQNSNDDQETRPSRFGSPKRSDQYPRESNPDATRRNGKAKELRDPARPKTAYDILSNTSNFAHTSPAPAATHRTNRPLRYPPDRVHPESSIVTSAPAESNPRHHSATASRSPNHFRQRAGTFGRRYRLFTQRSPTVSAPSRTRT